MYPRQACVTIRLKPSQAEVIYYELLGLIDYYSNKEIADFDEDSETAMRLAVTQLELGLTRANAQGELQLQQLRAITKRKEVA